MKHLNFAAVLFISAFMTACGGGGSGGVGSGTPSASAAAPFTVANFGSVAGPSAASVLIALSGDTGLDQIASADRGIVLPSTTTKLVLWTLSRHRSVRESVQAVQTIPAEACPGGGTLSGYVNDIDPR